MSLTRKIIAEVIVQIDASKSRRIKTEMKHYGTSFRPVHSEVMNEMEDGLPGEKLH